MTKSSKMREPWRVTLLALLGGPVLGMLYLNRGKVVLAYCTMFFVLFILSFLLPHFGILHINPPDLFTYMSIVPHLGGVIHCYITARNGTLGSLKWYSHFHNILLMTAALLSVALLIRIYFYEPFNAASSSMEPTIHRDDYFFINKHLYSSTHLPQRGDVVVFNVQNNGATTQFIKRIIGLPGDKILVSNEEIDINGARVQRQPEPNNVNGTYRETLPDGKQFYILLDHTPAELTDLTPKTYDVPTGQYFVMGDNRSNSRDSSNGLGYISFADIKGKAMAVIWNLVTYKISYSPIN